MSNQKKYQVFISSTFRDLTEERQDAIRNVLDLGHIPAGMELFPASDTEQLSYIKKVIDECDYYLLLMGGRYGSLDSDGISFTEREYDYAVEAGKTVLAFVHGDTSQISLAKSDTSPRLQQGLAEFRAKVMTGRLVREWTTRENLEPLVLKALIRAFSDYPAIGWVRGDAVASDDALQQAHDLLVENKRLIAELESATKRSFPEIENLADFNDTIEVHYTYYHEDNPGYSYGSTQASSVQLIWRDIFVYVAPALKAPASSATLQQSLNRLVIDKTGIDSDTEVKRTDADMIEMHLVAMGLINSFNHESDKGFKTAMIEISEAGRIQLIEALAVRKPDRASG